MWILVVRNGDGATYSSEENDELVAREDIGYMKGRSDIYTLLIDLPTVTIFIDRYQELTIWAKKE